MELIGTFDCEQLLATYLMKTLVLKSGEINSIWIKV